MKKILFLTLSLSLVTAATVQTQNRNQSPKERRKEIAVTFDDLPATQGDLAVWEALTAKLLRSVKRQGVPAIGFVNEGKLYHNDALNPRAVALLRQWLEAGFELGNHTYSHIAIDQASLEQYQQDVIRGETVTRGLLVERGKKLRYFRHTQLRTGPTLEYKQGLDKFLATRGYTTAPVTIDSNEYLTLEQALQDEAYRLPEAQATRGLSWLHRWMLAKGWPMEPEPAEPEFILQRNNTRRR